MLQTPASSSLLYTLLSTCGCVVVKLVAGSCPGLRAGDLANARKFGVGWSVGDSVCVSARGSSRWSARNIFP